MHTSEGGIVFSSQSAVFFGLGRVLADAAHRLYIVGAMHRAKFDVGGHVRRLNRHMAVVEKTKGFCEPRG
jgi:hypothetical protein